MTISPISALAPNASAPPSRDTAGSGDLFGDLLRVPANSAAASPATGGERDVAAKPADRPDPRPAAEPADRPERPAANDAKDGSDAADAKPSKAKDAQDGGDTKPAAKDTDKTDANAKTDDGAANKADAPQAVPLNAIAAAVLAQLTTDEPHVPAATGETAATAAVAAAGAPATPAVAAKPDLTPAAPVPVADPTQTDAPVTPDGKKKGASPAQVTVTADGKTLVSRPAAALADVKVQDIAPESNDAKPADPKAPVNAAVTPDQRTAPLNDQPKDGGGKTVPVQDPAVSVAADAVKPADTPAPVKAAHADHAAQQIQINALNTVVSAPVAPAHANAAAAAPINVNVAAPPAPAPVPAGTDIDQVALTIGKAAADGMDRISIQLKPESMGRIDVQLNVHTDGRVHATIAADRQDTLDLLQRDARSLERALNDAGLRADAGSLSFNLSGQGQENAAGAPHSPAPSYAPISTASEPQPLPAAQLAAYNAAAARGGVDIRV